MIIQNTIDIDHLDNDQRELTGRMISQLLMTRKGPFEFQKISKIIGGIIVDTCVVPLVPIGTDIMGIKFWNLTLARDLEGTGKVHLIAHIMNLRYPNKVPEQLK